MPKTGNQVTNTLLVLLLLSRRSYNFQGFFMFGGIRDQVEAALIHGLLKDGLALRALSRLDTPDHTGNQIENLRVLFTKFGIALVSSCK